jgi:asparagine synthase (glutamine-hydrolysing)
MCGIAGIASRDPVSERAWLATGRDAMAHRGPDNAGEWWSADGRVGLGHRRLSVIDLSPFGNQPMVDESGYVRLVLNGEIYNFLDLRGELEKRGYTFRSRSDTEVLLAAYREWGTECLEKINGMFAFALFDEKRRLLFLARDRAGEKPLFYREANGAIRFASELKALMSDPALERRIDEEALDCYLAMGFVAGDRCLIKGCRKLPPAHALTYSLESGESRIWRYWNVPEPDMTVRESRFSETELIREFEFLLEDTLRRQLTADVPVGILLSGGVDSSLITAIASRIKPQLTTFTIRFPGHGEFDETVHARLIARHFGTEHIELEAAESTVDLLPLLARQFDEPMADSSMIPTYMVSKLVRRYCTVALGGDGGDELFGGYIHHNRLLWLQRNLGWIPRFLRASAATAAERLLPVGFKGRNWLQGLDIDMKRGLPLIASCFDRTTRRKLMADHPSWKLVAEGVREARIPQNDDILQRATRMDFENYLPDDILVKVDRASMLNSLEIRAPLLDHRIIEFAFGKVPSHLKTTDRTRKILLKKAAENLLPREFDHHRKQGFSIPLGQWLQKGPWKNFFQEVLLDSKDTFFNRAVLRSLMEGQGRGRANSERLFALVLFELWRREYRVSL